MAAVADKSLAVQMQVVSGTPKAIAVRLAIHSVVFAFPFRSLFRPSNFWGPAVALARHRNPPGQGGVAVFCARSLAQWQGATAWEPSRRKSYALFCACAWFRRYGVRCTWYLKCWHSSSFRKSACPSVGTSVGGCRVGAMKKADMCIFLGLVWVWRVRRPVGVVFELLAFVVRASICWLVYPSVRLSVRCPSAAAAWER